MESPFEIADLTPRERDSRCVICKGARMLCGKSSCPILVKYYYQLKTKPLIDALRLEGSSPPSVFVGRIGYPKVYVGPLIPPVSGDTSLLDTPESWINNSIEDIVSFRSQLVRGKYRVDAFDVEGGRRIVDMTRELALCTSSVDSEAEFLKRPSGRLMLDDEVQPFGPSAPLRKLDVTSLKIDRKIERAYDDTDLKAVDAVVDLYDGGVLVSKIQRAFSVGAFGIGKNRRFVPTRWSITAVDDTLGKDLRERVKEFPLINEFRVYESWRLDNRFMVLMIPSSWCYELIEAWYPNTVWNPTGRRILLFSDHEGYGGRSKYAGIGGCYYAARLAISEHLEEERRQAAAVILREVHSGYIMPVGVWNVRENVRNAVRGEPRKFDTLKGALNYISAKLEIPLERWILNSKLLKDFLYQRKLEDFLKG
ncbi:MAG: Nre family DNA repair protein [Candidatus Hydrothermarchaeales archaeon]